jgi:hypothetical protein
MGSDAQGMRSLEIGVWRLGLRSVDLPAAGGRH